MKNKKIKLWGIIVSFSIIFSIIFSYTNIIKANEENVTNFQELKRAIESNSSVNITASFDVPEMITIPSSYTGTIKGNNNTLTLGATIENMFYLKGANVTFENIILDGAEKGRLMNISGGTVNLVDSKLTKGTTRYYEPKLRDTRDEQNYQGGALFVNGANVNLENTIFENNYTKEDTPRNAATPDGGALYAGSRSTINVVGGKFIGNHTGGPTALGGAIMIEGGAVLNINRETDTQEDKTVFERNHNLNANLNNHGGAVQVKNASANIYATKFNVYKPFEIGGALHFHSANAVVKNSKFIIDSLGDAYAISGGAIATYDSNLEVDNSKFIAIGKSKITFAGGFIDVVGGGKFHLTNSTLTGQGQGNGKELASFGGAIAFETGSSAKAWIDNVTITDVSSSDTGGAIAIGTRKGEERYDYEDGNFGPYSNQSVTITNSTITNTQTLFWGRQPGGAIYVGPRNSALVYNTNITNSKAGLGGGIYNMGTVTLDGGTSINGSYAMLAGASIFNDGKLILGNSSVNASFTGDAHWNGNYTKYKNPLEYPGINIYAKKDIIVTPDASFNDKDIKVLDGVSSIVLTNNINKKINVSISENVGTNNEDKELYETSRRYIGYTVARGIKPTDLENIPETYYPPRIENVRFIPDVLPNEYKVSNTDAQFLHYVTKDQNQATSPYEDHSSLGQWDYVLNPEDNSIVLGQRVKMVYHTNEEGATIEGGSEDTGHVGQKLDQVYTVYKSGGGKAKVSVENKPVKEITPIDKVPSLEGYKFKSWNKASVVDKAKYDVHKLEEVYDFSSENNTFTLGTTEEITTLIDPNTLHTYAIYDKPLTVKVKKVWNAQNKAPVTMQLVRTDKNNEVIEEKVIDENSSDYIEFAAVPKVEDGQDITSKYAVIEKGINQQDIVTLSNDKKYLVDYKDETEEITRTTNEKSTKYISVKNTELLDISVRKEWANENNIVHNENITIDLYNGDSKVSTINLEATKNYVGKFENLPKLNEQGEEINYTVKEANVTDENIVSISDREYTVTIGGDINAGFVVTNTYIEPKQEAVLRFYTVEPDGKTNKTLVNDATYEKTGANSTPITFENYQTKLDELKGLGYEVVSDNYNGSATFDTDAATKQEFEVVLKPTIVETTETKEITRTITYEKQDIDGQNPEKLDNLTYTNTVTYTRTVTENKVTKEKTEGQWTSADKDLEGNQLPDIEGYIPVSSTRDGQDQDPTNTQNVINTVDTTSSIKEHVIYRPVPEAPKQEAVLRFYTVEPDGKTNKTLVNDATYEKTGANSTPITFENYQNKLGELKAQGYEVVSDNYNGSATFDTDTATKQEFEVILKPTIVETTETKEITRTITYEKQDIDGQNPEKLDNLTYTNTVTYTRTVTENKVTKVKTEEEWTSSDKDLEGKALPEIEGYIPVSSTRNGESQDPTNTQNVITTTETTENIKENVVYRPVPEAPKQGEVKVNFIDETTRQALIPEEIDTPTSIVGTKYDVTDHKKETITVGEKQYVLVPEKSGTRGDNGTFTVEDTPVTKETGDVVEGTTYVNYVYKEKAKGSVIVKYRIKGDNATEIKSPVTDTIDAYVGTSYTTEEHKTPEIIYNGKTYILVANQKPDNETGTVKEETIIVTYIYNLKPVPVTPLTPATTKVKVTKAWVGEKKENKVTVALVKNGNLTD
ncbi:mucin-binding protein, partial [Gemelliphila palaticanis]